jgi:hypothetical protein
VSSRQPPALATWLLDKLGYTRQNAALAGDLLEEFCSGRSAAWYWRQTLMVIVSGLGRNAALLQTYLKAVAAGFAIQIPVAFVLWWFHSPQRVHGWGWGILAALLVLAGLLLAVELQSFVLRRMGIGRASRDLKLLLVRGAEGSQDRPALARLVAFQTFTTFLLYYCLCALFAPVFTVGELIGVEMIWLAFDLVPALVRVPATGPAEPSEIPVCDEAPPRQWPPANEQVLPVSCTDGATFLLRPETVVGSVFAAADADLAATLFQRGMSLEQVRRAIWLGCAGNYLAMLKDQAATPVTGLPELATLLEAAAHTKPVLEHYYVAPRESHWRRLRRRLTRMSSCPAFAIRWSRRRFRKS